MPHEHIIHHEEEYFEKFDDYSYIIAPKANPYRTRIELYRGDEISISIKGIHLNDAQDPFDFSFFDSFHAHFRIVPMSSRNYPATEDNFVLGQSEEAIQYDIDQGNPSNTTMDELHFIDPDFSILGDYKVPHVHLDIQGHVSDSIYTFMRFNIKVKQDITKNVT